MRIQWLAATHLGSSCCEGPIWALPRSSVFAGGKNLGGGAAMPPRTILSVGTPSGPGRMGKRPILARYRFPFGMRIRWLAATHLGSSCCEEPIWALPRTSVFAGGKNLGGGAAMPPRTILSVGTPSGPGRMGKRPILARYRFSFGMRTRWLAATHLGSSCCNQRHKPRPEPGIL